MVIPVLAIDWSEAPHPTFCAAVPLQCVWMSEYELPLWLFLKSCGLEQSFTFFSVMVLVSY